MADAPRAHGHTFAKSWQQFVCESNVAKCHGLLRLFRHVWIVRTGCSTKVVNADVSDFGSVITAQDHYFVTYGRDIIA